MLDERRMTLKGALEAVRAIGWKAGSIIDIGIDKGTKGLYDIWPDVPICLVEPSPRGMDRMRQIQQRFSDVRIYNVGASDHNGEVTGIQHPTRPVVAMGNVKRKWGDASSFPVM